MLRALLVCSVALLGASGCAVTFNDSAPATPGSRYVVGSRNNEPVVYLCPEKPKAGECQLVDVTVND